MSLLYFPYTTNKDTIIPVKQTIPAQYNLAPYLPQLAQEVKSSLDKPNMSLAKPKQQVYDQYNSSTMEQFVEPYTRRNVNQNINNKVDIKKKSVQNIKNDMEMQKRYIQKIFKK